MKDLIRLVVVMTLVSLVAGILLAVTQQYTKEPIRQAEQRELFDALKLVLPAGEGDPRVVTLSNAAGRQAVFYVSLTNGAVAGIAFSSASPNGYAGPVEALIGLNAQGALQGIEIKQNETPGLGTKITAPAFKSQLVGKPLAGTAWKVKKDGGAVDAVSGATISSRALCEAVANGLALYQEFKPALDAALAAKETP